MPIGHRVTFVLGAVQDIPKILVLGDPAHVVGEQTTRFAKVLQSDEPTASNK